MKKNLSQILLVLIIACSCSTSKTITKSQVEYSKLSKEELETKNKNLITKQNHLIAQKYLKLNEQQNRTIPLGGFGWKEVEEYWTLVHELKEYRSEFEESDGRLENFLIEKDDRYLPAVERYRQKEISAKELKTIKYSVYKNLAENYPSEYGTLRKDRDNKLRISNHKTLEYIIADYHQEEKIFPVNWIPNQILSQLKKDKSIRNISKELEMIKNVL